MSATLTFAVAALLALGTATDAGAQLHSRDRSAIEKMVYASIYLRTEVPTDDAVDAFIEISPTGYSWSRLAGAAEARAKQKNRPSPVYFPFRPNDMVRWGAATFGERRITVWFQGIRDELKVIFLEVQSLEDFKKAFDQVFAAMPLQDEHKEWPDEIRQAIADRRVLPGMTKAQALCVVGASVRKEPAGDDGETWYPRQETGDRRSGWPAVTGLPARLRFTGDRLVSVDSRRP